MRATEEKGGDHDAWRAGHDRHGPDRHAATRHDDGHGRGYEAVERRDRGIVRHLVLSLVAGIAAGAVGTAIYTTGLTALDAIYDPYAYFVLAIVVGRTAAGLCWAAPAGAVAAFAPLIPVLVGLDLTQRQLLTRLGTSASGLDLLVLLLFLYAVAAHAAGRRDLWGDVVAGLLLGALLADVAARAMTAAAHTWFAPWGALVTGVLLSAPALAARPTLAGRARSLALALLIGAGCLFGAALAR